MLTTWSGVCRLTYSIAPRSSAAEALRWSCGLSTPFGPKTAVPADHCKLHRPHILSTRVVVTILVESYSRDSPQHCCRRRVGVRLISLSVTCKRDASSRPSLDDVERISKGDAAKARGTGSRRIPHRLNAEERQQYDIAKQKGFLTLRGTGYRKERKGSPLANTFRQWCDAQASLCVVIEQGFGTNAMDTVLVDMSTLRHSSPDKVKEHCIQLAADQQCNISEEQTMIPFTIEVSPTQAVMNNGQDDAAAEQGQGQSDADGSAQEQVGKHAEDSSSVQSSRQADVQGHANSGDDVSPSEQQLDYTTLNSKERKRLASSSPLAPIWTVPAEPIFFDADRPTAKQLAKSLVAMSVDQLLYE